MASDFHCTTWSTKTTHHNTRFTQEEVCGRQEQEFEDWAHLESSSTHIPLSLFTVRLSSLQLLSPSPVDRPSSEYTGEPS